MKWYIQILTCDGDWITYAVRSSEESAKAVALLLEIDHNFSIYQIRIVI